MSLSVEVSKIMIFGSFDNKDSNQNNEIDSFPMENGFPITELRIKISTKGIKPMNTEEEEFQNQEETIFIAHFVIFFRLPIS